MNLFQHISVEEFLSDFWQKKPYLFKHVFDPSDIDLELDELAGLAYEESVESRLVTVESSTYKQKLGPFNEQDFENLGEKNWTLLLQAIDLYLPELSALKQSFRFIPDWRVDDIMASISTEGGSVGPHFDYYDVFLIQASGTKHWMLGQHCTSKSTLANNPSMKILEEFEIESQHIVEAGDVLYVPPKLAHHGIAKDLGMTLSVGFRALSKIEMLDSFAGFLAEENNEDDRFEDARPTIPKNPGEITPDVIENIKQAIISQLTDERLKAWFGQIMTEPKYSDQIFETPEPVSSFDELHNQFTYLIKAHDARLAYTVDQELSIFFANGFSEELRDKSIAELAAQLANNWHITINEQPLTPPQQLWLIKLYNSGIIEGAE